MGSTILSASKGSAPRGWQRDPRLAQIVAAIMSAAHRRFPNLARNDLAMTLFVPDHNKITGASIHGNRPIYPASVVKLFYLVAMQAWLEAGKLRPTAELWAAMAAM